ncbi:uncharacterized protein LOC135963479 [Calliphora vicina]|uniref:uncharacterized protein LOC135963479 n=1 Tax=Calliphora vicina TaxID=7373 RepID=UPI00325B8D0D
MSEVCSERRGITWSISRQLEDLDYADDICLLSHKISNMQAKMDDLERLARNVGLEINIKKTKAMRINNVSTDYIMLQGQPVEYVESFCYLGSTVSTNGGAETDAKFYTLLKLYNQQDISHMPQTAQLWFCCSVVCPPTTTPPPPPQPQSHTSKLTDSVTHCVCKERKTKNGQPK